MRTGACCISIVLQLFAPELSFHPPGRLRLSSDNLCALLPPPSCGGSGRTRQKQTRCRGALRLDGEHDDWQLREFVLASIQVEPLDASSRATCMAVAALRCDAFQAPHSLSIDEKIAQRFDAVGVIRERLSKGAACLVASIEGPFPPGILLRLKSREELQVDADKEAFDKLESARDGRVFAQGALEGTAHVRKVDTRPRNAQILETWRNSTHGRRLILGAIDVSTHEFDLSPEWREWYGDDGAYFSDMAVEAVSMTQSRSRPFVLPAVLPCVPEHPDF